MVHWCNYVRRGVAVFFEYDTPKIVHIRSKSIGILNRVIQLAIFAYIIGWVFIYQAGYQKEDVGVPGTTTKVKGVATSNLSGIDPRVGMEVWDTEDIVVPAEENGAFFVTTNAIVTKGQQQGECAESRDVKDALCVNDTSCQPAGTHFNLGHGASTGKCNKTTGTCMIRAWCPLENDTLINPDYPILQGTADFTVLIKNHVYFPYYKKTRSNILESANKTYLQKCTYNPETNPFCPVFKLGDVVDNALSKAVNSTTYDQLALEGGVISIRINWRCNFDHDPKECKPTYDFDRLDKGEDSLIAKGYNFRYSNVYFDSNGTKTRELIKAFGLLFIITVDARARAFNVLPTFQNLGSGLALLAVATILCDMFVLYVHKRRLFFKKRKYEDVVTPDAYRGLERREDPPPLGVEIDDEDILT